jgi:phosphatidylserine/phosphatidylglycerophosphate/cardiolipin synthase-like enzyme
VDVRLSFRRLRLCCVGLVVAAAIEGTAAPAEAFDQLCDSSIEDCRRIILDRIRAEPAEISVGAWFFEDARFTSELIARWRAGVRVRVIADPRANPQHPVNETLLQQMAGAGIPIRRKATSGIEHWKMMLFAGQGVVYFGSANFSDDAMTPNQPYVDYVDETVYLTDDPRVVNSFKAQYDNAWVDATNYANYANAPNSSVVRHYSTYPLDPEMNWAPATGSASYRSRSVAAYAAETQRIDVIMYRITDQAHVDALIGAHRRGVPVRVYHEQRMYRDQSQLWHSMSIDKLYAAGIPIRERAHAGLNHQKLVLLYGQQLSIFGSSNMTSKSSDSQHEHNYFTRKANLFGWFAAQFARKWNNAVGVAETAPFVPLPPDTPSYVTPAISTVGVPTTGVKLVWHGGPWAHVYDIYFGATPNPPLFAAAQALGPSANTTQRQSFRLPRLAPGTTYYWRIVSRTMANLERSGAVSSFTTLGTRGSVDFDGDGSTDVAVFRRSTGEWFIRYTANGASRRIVWGGGNDVPLAGDFDGDGLTDIVAFRPTTGEWWIRYMADGASGRLVWGGWGDTPVPRDYDGDGLTDVAVFRPATGEWFIRYTGPGSAIAMGWGIPGDVPVPGDYDGDRLTDLAVFRPSTGEWFVRHTATGLVTAVTWGWPGDVALPGDYDGDRLTDFAVFRPTTGEWLVLTNATRAGLRILWGGAGDVPTPGDYDRDGITDVGIFRRSTGQWLIRSGRTGATLWAVWGGAGDIAIVAR